MVYFALLDGSEMLKHLFTQGSNIVFAISFTLFITYNNICLRMGIKLSSKCGICINIEEDSVEHKY